MSAIFCLLFALLFFIVSYFQYAITACIFPRSSVQTLPRTVFFSALQSISRLPPDRHRQCILMYYGKEMSLAEIAEVYGVTVSRISQILSEARGRLRKKLAPYVDKTDLALDLGE